MRSLGFAIFLLMTVAFIHMFAGVFEFIIPGAEFDSVAAWGNIHSGLAYFMVAIVLDGLRAISRQIIALLTEQRDSFKAIASRRPAAPADTAKR